MCLARPPHFPRTPPLVDEHSYTPDVPPAPTSYSQAETLPPPPGFAILQTNFLPCHIPKERLPWRIHAGDVGHIGILDRALEIWNRTGLDLGLGYLYQRTDDPSAADVQIRWYDPQLPADKAGATWWGEWGNQRRVLGLSMDGAFPIPDGNRVQILAHELGHVLGLGESQDSGDLMFYQMNRRRLHPQQVQLSLRDKLALRWLYQQTRFAAIRSRNDINY